MGRRNGPGGMIVFGFGDRRYGTWGTDVVHREPPPKRKLWPHRPNPRPELDKVAEAQIAKLRIAVKASENAVKDAEKAVKDAERQLRCDRDDLAALLAKYGLPPEA